MKKPYFIRLQTIIKLLRTGIQISPSPEPFHFSSNPTSTGDPSVFSNFTYSDVLLYDRALSEEEIMEVFSGEINKNKVSLNKLLFYYDFK